MADHGLLPIHFELSVWAMKKGLTYEGRADQNTHGAGREAGEVDDHVLPGPRPLQWPHHAS